MTIGLLDLSKILIEIEEGTAETNKAAAEESTWDPTWKVNDTHIHSFSFLQRLRVVEKITKKSK